MGYLYQRQQETVSLSGMQSSRALTESSGAKHEVRHKSLPARSCGVSKRRSFSGRRRTLPKNSSVRLVREIAGASGRKFADPTIRFTSRRGSKARKGPFQIQPSSATAKSVAISSAWRASRRSARSAHEGRFSRLSRPVTTRRTQRREHQSDVQSPCASVQRCC